MPRAVQRAREATEAPLVKRKPGRPKGTTGIKARKTLLKEYELGKVAEQFNLTMALEMQKVVDAVVKKAKDGDIPAAKLLFDRVLPLRDRNEDATGGREIVINIGGLNERHEKQIREAITIEPGPAERQPGAGSQEQSLAVEHSARRAEASEGLDDE